MIIDEMIMYKITIGSGGKCSLLFDLYIRLMLLFLCRGGLLFCTLCPNNACLSLGLSLFGQGFSC
jgi:hypothetical protein